MTTCSRTSQMQSYFMRHCSSTKTKTSSRSNAGSAYPGHAWSRTLTWSERSRLRQLPFQIASTRKTAHDGPSFARSGKLRLLQKTLRFGCVSALEPPSLLATFVDRGFATGSAPILWVSSVSAQQPGQISGGKAGLVAHIPFSNWTLFSKQKREPWETNTLVRFGRARLAEWFHVPLPYLNMTEIEGWEAKHCQKRIGGNHTFHSGNIAIAR